MSAWQRVPAQVSSHRTAVGTIDPNHSLCVCHAPNLGVVPSQHTQIRRPVPAPTAVSKHQPRVCVSRA
eukprot:2003216-Prymnesium_polylepis.1